MARQTYTIIHEDWQDQPSEETPIMAEDLEHIEAGIKEAMDSRALKEIYNDRSIRLSEDNEEPTRPDIMSVEVGYKAKAPGNHSAAIGTQVEASALDAFAIGCGTKAIGLEQFVCGRYNVANANYIFIIGRGISDSARANIHTVDYSGNAWFKGDVANDQYSLNAIGSTAGTTDVTDTSAVTASGQAIDITVPLSIIMDGQAGYGNYVAGGDFIGVLIGNFPPMIFNMQMSAVKNMQPIGEAVLINTIQATHQMYGSRIKGEIEVSFSDVKNPTAKATFNFSVNVSVQYFTIYRTAGSAVDFSIAQLRSEIQSSTISADKLPIANEESLGGVKPDGTTITIDEDGTIHAVSSQELAESVLGGES